jgi:crossover junction endodeoxyribonuclease RuvC
VGLTQRVGISPKQLQEIQERLARPKTAGRAATDLLPSTARQHEVILGVDPSLRGTGYAVIKIAKPHAIALTHGTISIPARWERSRCLVKIYQTLRDIVREQQPTVCVMEGLFFAQNLQTALIMGEARGAAIVAAAETGLEIFEISPRKMKQAIVGFGGAQKLAVAKMAQRLLNLSELPAPDAADALALAIAFAQESKRLAIHAPKRI